MTIGVEWVLNVLGGMGLFLYGMFTMGEGLQDAAGDRMRRILEALTSNRVAAVVVGAVVTAIIQASGATTVMVVSFVNAGLMTLQQAIGVIMGANIGTTITAQMVAFKLERCALPAVALGVALRFLARKKQIRGLAHFFIGFGLLFLGISIMGQKLGVLKTYQPFIDLMIASQKNPIFGVLVGMVFTVAIQSSSATTSLLVTLASRGLIPLGAAVPMIFGANIGTTSTALIASVGTSLTARKAALAHLLFNVTGTVVWLPFLRVFETLAAMSSHDLGRQIANAHTLFNVSTTLVLLPFMDKFVSLIAHVLKGEESIVEHGTKYLNPRLIGTPFSAVVQMRKEVVRMAQLCRENLVAAVSVFLGRAKLDRRRFEDIEKVIDELEEAISYYVAKISQRSISDEQARTLTAMINVATDLERVGDHATAIVELADYKSEHNLPFSDEANQEIREMVQRVLDPMDATIDCLEKADKVKAATISTMDDAFDKMEEELRARHIKRLNQGICYPASGVVYLELLTHLERIGDHGVNIAKAVAGLG